MNYVSLCSCYDHRNLDNVTYPEKCTKIILRILNAKGHFNAILLAIIFTEFLEMCYFFFFLQKAVVLHFTTDLLNYMSSISNVPESYIS